MSGFRNGLRLQVWLFRRNPGYLLVFLSMPFFSAIFLSGVRESGQSTVLVYAVIGPALIGLWGVCMDIGGSIMDTERIQRTLELQVITPGSFVSVLAGRVAAVTILGLLAVPETMFFARLAFGVQVRIVHPLCLVLTLAVTGVAMAGTSAAMASVFVAIRAARRFANVLGYPFYILGGILVPVTLLPLWTRPLSWLSYLYWSADLLRASISPQPVAGLAWRLLATLGVGLAAYAAGARLISWIINRLRQEGTIGIS